MLQQIWNFLSTSIWPITIVVLNVAAIIYMAKLVTFMIGFIGAVCVGIYDSFKKGL